MLDVAVVYESMYGNTKTIAEAIAEGVRDADPNAKVAVMAAADASTESPQDTHLLVVGSPTHMLRWPSGRSRQITQTAVDKATKDGKPQATLEPGATTGPGVREWLQRLPSASERSPAAVFSTCLGSPWSGSATRVIGRTLRRRGYVVIAEERFVVTGGQGPLRPGERERARAWGAGLVRQPIH